MKSIFYSDFAYALGNFMADGSFYKDKSGCRFEFVDGSPYKSELKYSLEHISKIKSIFEHYLGKVLPKIRQRGNLFAFAFRDKELEEFFIKTLNILPGDKSRIIDIPSQYRSSAYEKYFWVGFLDGDGSIARESKRIAVESMSPKIIDSFAEYLDKLGIYYSAYESKRGNEMSYVVLIRSISFKDFAEKVGFYHPLKSILLKSKLTEREFYNINKIDKSVLGKSINYIRLFDGSVFLENGRELLLKYDLGNYPRSNIPLIKLVKIMRDNGWSDDKINSKIGNYRFKKSKGSMTSIKLPQDYNKDLIKLAKFVRLRGVGGISFSKAYINSYNECYEDILNLTERIFDIKPRYTCKNEPLFCSGVLADLFKSIIK